MIPAKPHDPLFGWLEQAQQTAPQRAAWLTTDVQLSYSTLYQQTQHLASHCLSIGLKPGEPLAAVYTDRQQISQAALLAIYLGCPLLPLKPQRSALLPLLKQCGITQYLSAAPLAGINYRHFPLPLDYVEGSPADCPPQPLPGNRSQLFIATSGSSGTARITRHSGNNLQASVTASHLYTGLTQGDIWLNCLPMHHIGGFSILLRCLHAGATMLIEENFNAERIFADLQQFNVTHLSLVPAMLAKLLHAQGNHRLPDSLRCVLIGGGPLSATLAQQALAQGWPLSVTWGMSETASHVTLCRVQPGWKPGMVGQPVQGCRLDIVDSQGHKVINGHGLIRISGPMLMQGYCHAQDPPDNSIEADCFTSSDTGYLDTEGNLHLCGRADNQLVSAGYNIDPEMLEAALSQCEGVEQVAVTAIEDAVWGDLLLVLFSGPATQQALMQWCQSHLDSWTRPRHVLKTTALPCTSLGKPDRPAITRLATQLLVNSIAAPLTPSPTGMRRS